ncbi:MAG: hypothetical protein Q8L20_11055 [Gammaproteobacteria bacterium]|nr:hypothetical protein [Gammaproteobacteria bacterium]
MEQEMVMGYAQKPYQPNLFTPGGKPFTPRAMADETKLSVLTSLGALYGQISMDEPCPVCTAPQIFIVPIPAAFAYCKDCGWHIDDIFEEEA